MTTIIGIETDEGVLLGADSAMSVSDTLTIEARIEKLWRPTTTVVIGYAGPWRTGQVLKYHLSLHRLLNPDDPEKWCAVDLADSIQVALERGSVENDGDWGLLVGIKDQLFIYGADLSGVRCIQKWAVIGSGDKAALGSLYTTECINNFAFENDESLMTEEVRVILALGAAASFDHQTDGPFMMLNNYPPTPGPQGAASIHLLPPLRDEDDDASEAALLS